MTHARPIAPLPWPTLSVASAVLPVVRRELLADSRAPGAGVSIAMDVCAIVEEGLLGYELAPYAGSAPFVMLGCGPDALPCVRSTRFDPNASSALRLATVQGQPIDASGRRGRSRAYRHEVFFADWRSAARAVWNELGAVLREHGPQWQRSMATCRSLENALAIAALHLAEWDPAVDFCGLVHQAEYGLALRDANGGSGTLTLRRDEVWLLEWRSGQRVVRSEFSPFTARDPSTTVLPRDASA